MSTARLEKIESTIRGLQLKLEEETRARVKAEQQLQEALENARGRAVFESKIALKELEVYCRGQLAEIIRELDARLPDADRKWPAVDVEVSEYVSHMSDDLKAKLQGPGGNVGKRESGALLDRHVRVLQQKVNILERTVTDVVREGPGKGAAGEGKKSPVAVENGIDAAARGSIKSLKTEVDVINATLKSIKEKLQKVVTFTKDRVVPKVNDLELSLHNAISSGSVSGSGRAPPPTGTPADLPSAIAEFKNAAQSTHRAAEALAILAEKKLQEPSQEREQISGVLPLLRRLVAVQDKIESQFRVLYDMDDSNSGGPRAVELQQNISDLTSQLNRLQVALEDERGLGDIVLASATTPGKAKSQAFSKESLALEREQIRKQLAEMERELAMLNLLSSESPRVSVQQANKSNAPNGQAEIGSPAPVIAKPSVKAAKATSEPQAQPAPARAAPDTAAGDARPSLQVQTRRESAETLPTNSAAPAQQEPAKVIALSPKKLEAAPISPQLASPVSPTRAEPAADVAPPQAVPARTSTVVQPRVEELKAVSSPPVAAASLMSPGSVRTAEAVLSPISKDGRRESIQSGGDDDNSMLDDIDDILP